MSRGAARRADRRRRRAAGRVFAAGGAIEALVAAHHESFERQVLPELIRRDAGVIGMKPMADGRIVQHGFASAEECLRYAMSLPASVVVTGCDSVERVEQALRVARAFRVPAEREVDALLARTAAPARGGANELYETTQEYDGTAQNPDWL